MTNQMTVAFGCDHGGFNLKGALIKALRQRKIRVVDFGSDSDQISVDYPDYAVKVARSVASKKADFGILCCGTGIGMSIAANKIRGIRAAVVWNEKSALATREHNASNIICLGGRMMNAAMAVKILKTYLGARPSSEARHRRRVAKISRLDKPIKK